MDKTVKLLTAVFLALLSCLAIRTYFFVNEASAKLTGVSKEVLIVMQKTQQSMDAWKAYSDSVTDKLNDPQVQRSIGLLIRSGDDISFAIKRLNSLLESTRTSVEEADRRFNHELLPAITEAVRNSNHSINEVLIPDLQSTAAEATSSLNASTALMLSARNDLSSITASLQSEIEGLGTLTEHVQTRVDSPQITQAIDDLRLAAEATKHSAENVERGTALFGWVLGGPVWLVKYVAGVIYGVFTN